MMPCVVFAVNDAPSCGFDAVNVTIQKVRIHQSSSAADSDAGWSEVTLSPARRVDLLSLQNGVLSELGQTLLVPGKYQQVRLVLADNDTTSPMAHSLLATGGAPRTLGTPRAQQTGPKMNVELDVPAGEV